MEEGGAQAVMSLGTDVVVRKDWIWAGKVGARGCGSPT